MILNIIIHVAAAGPQGWGRREPQRRQRSAHLLKYSWVIKQQWAHLNNNNDKKNKNHSKPTKTQSATQNSQECPDLRENDEDDDDGDNDDDGDDNDDDGDHNEDKDDNDDNDDNDDGWKLTRFRTPMMRTPVLRWQQQRNFSTVGKPILDPPPRLKQIMAETKLHLKQITKMGRREMNRISAESEESAMFSEPCPNVEWLLLFPLSLSPTIAWWQHVHTPHWSTQFTN